MESPKDIHPTLNQVAFIARLDSDGNFLEINEKFLRFLGLKEVDVLGTPISALISSDDNLNILPYLSFSLKHGLSWEGEACYQARNGDRFWAQGTIAPTDKIPGESQFYFYIAFNVTERKAVEVALNKAQTFTQRIMELAPVGFSIADETGQCTYVNQKWTESTGFKLRDAIGDNWVQAIHEDDKMKVTHSWHEFVKQDLPMELGYRYLKPDGYESYVYVEAKKIDGPYGLTLIRIERDLTSLKQKDQTINEQRVKLFHSAKINSLLDMAAGVAHEINNPTAIVKSKANQIIRNLQSTDPDLNRIQNAANVIDVNADRIAGIVKSLISLTGDQDPETFLTVSFQSCLETALSFYSARMAAKSIQMTVSDPVSDIALQCQSSLIGQMLVQLLSNALDAVETLSERWIDLTFEVVKGRLRVCLENSGPKLTSEVEARLFEPFFSTKPPGKGMGLGLSIARTIAESHGGSVVYDSQRAHTVFVIDIPIQQNQRSSTQ